MPDTVEIRQNSRNKWYWHIKAANGRILCHSEDYGRRRDCLKSANAFIKRHPAFLLVGG